MSFKEELDCWYVSLGDDKGYTIHCGDYFELHIGNGISLSCRMELDQQWYIIFGENDVKVDLKPNETYQIVPF